MLKKAALVAGLVFLLVGIAGFIPGLTTTDDSGMKLLIGLFMVDGIHNWVHILSGVAALACAGSERLAQLYFQIFGVVYGVVTVLGFIVGSGNEVLGFLPVNTADNFLHLGITLIALYLGFAYRTAAEPVTTE